MNVEVVAWIVVGFFLVVLIVALRMPRNPNARQFLVARPTPRARRLSSREEFAGAAFLVIIIGVGIWAYSRYTGQGQQNAAAIVGSVALSATMTENDLNIRLGQPDGSGVSPVGEHRDATLFVRNEINKGWYSGLVSARFSGDSDKIAVLTIQKPFRGSVDGMQLVGSCNEAEAHFSENRRQFSIECADNSGGAYKISVINHAFGYKKE